MTLFPFCLLSLAADLIHVFSSVPRHLNFIDHTSDIGWKEYVLSEHSNSECYTGHCC
jgi:hypothetical protein